MLKFLPAEEFLKMLSVSNKNESDLVYEYVDTDYDFGDFDVRYSYFSGNLIIRFYSDEVGYHFEAPIRLTDNADVRGAYVKISEYCRLEAIPEIIVGIPSDERELVLRGAEHYNQGEDNDGTYAIEILTECMLCDELPECLFGDVYLGEFAESYADEYAKLVKNVNLNKHFGYNITDDLPDGSGIDFIKFVRDEFETGESMTFAATVLSDSSENVFVGEGVLYAFDGRGGASVSFRVLPDYHRRGIGRKIFLGLVKIADSLGLKTLYAGVMKENLASAALLTPFSSSSCEDEEKINYSFDVRKIASEC